MKLHEDQEIRIFVAMVFARDSDTGLNVNVGYFPLKATDEVERIFYK